MTNERAPMTALKGNSFIGLKWGDFVSEVKVTPHSAPGWGMAQVPQGEIPVFLRGLVVFLLEGLIYGRTAWTSNVGSEAYLNQ